MGAVDVGIDFGTTNCAIGYRAPGSGRVTVRGPISSVGAWSNGKAVFGEDALNLLRSGDRTVFPLRDIKMLLGSGMISAGRWPVDPVEAAAELLMHVRRQISQTVPNEDIGNAVIGTPVRASRQDRIALREAAEIAGFDAVHFIYEPTAALIGARNEAGLAQRGLILVVDWGGGTLDIAVIRVEDGVFRELTVDGDRADLGGSRMDEELTRLLLTDNPEAEKMVSGFPGGFFRLMEDVEEQKIDILESLDEESGGPRRVLPGWLDYEFWLSPGMVFDVVGRYARRAQQQIARMLLSAGIAPSEITQILFAGGTCKTHLVRDELMAGFPHAEVLDRGYPQLMTAEGCSRLTGRKFAVELASDFVVRESDDNLCVLLHSGQRVELDAYRMFDFRVTDVSATEAHFDLGSTHTEVGRERMLAADDVGFQSLGQLYVPVGQTNLANGNHIPDIVRLYVGVDRNLTVAVHGEGNRLRQSAQDFITGVPMAVRIGES